MTRFGDWEPEDSWDCSDRIECQVSNILARLDALDGKTDQRLRWSAVLDVIERRLTNRREQQRDPTMRSLVAVDNERRDLRIQQLMEDMEFVRERDLRGE